MKRYSEYKDSGIEWIGDIPKHWESWKISHAFDRIGSGTTPESGNPIYHENGDVNWLNTGDLNDGVLLDCNKKITEKALKDYSSLKLFPSGSLAIAMYGATIGKTALLDFETTTNQACCVFCESEIIELKYLQYWFVGNKEQIINLAIGGGQPNISQAILKEVRVPCPNIKEQTQIAHYLDYKTRQIDELIAKKEQLITLLQEERTAMITEMVTGKKVWNGNAWAAPDKVKDSGIEWLGEIPEHWEVKRIKHTTYIKGRIGWKGLRSDEFLEQSDSFVVTGTDFKNGKIQWESCYQVPFDRYEDDPFIKLQNDDLLITKDGTIGKIAIVKDMPKIATLNSGVFLTRPKGNFYIQEFMYWVLFSDVFKTFYDFNKSGSTIQHLYQNVFNEFKYPLPPKKEQHYIAEYIDSNYTEMTNIMSNILNEIELLNEYKTALISEVVTGKVDLRDEKLN